MSHSPLSDTLPAFSSIVFQQAATAYQGYRLAIGSEGCLLWDQLPEDEARAWASFADVCLRLCHESPRMLGELGHEAYAASLGSPRWGDLDPGRHAGYRAAAAAILAGLAQLKNRTEEDR